MFDPRSRGGSDSGAGTALAEAKRLCEAALAGLTEACDPAAQGAAGNLEPVEEALATLD